jgi:Mg-chelatase subunit ChlI
LRKNYQSIPSAALLVEIGKRVQNLGADKGGVGKTTIARTLLDYLPTRGRRGTLNFHEEPSSGSFPRSPS